MSLPVYVVGAGGHGKVVVSTLQAAGFAVEGVFDDDPRKDGAVVLGVPVLGTIEALETHERCRAVLAIGDNAFRKELAERLRGVEWVTAVHPTAVVHPSVQVAAGTVIFAGAVIQPDTVIGVHGIVNTAATVDHDGVLGDYVHVAPGVHLAGEVRLGDGVFLGVGASVVSGRAVGDWSTVGAGGVVVRDVPAGVVAVGVPAQPVSTVR